MLRMIIIGMACLSTSLTATAAPPAPTPPLRVAKGDFYVSTAGNDAWSGKLAAPNAAKTDGPFATVAAAKKAVRKLRAAKPDRKMPVVVAVRGGFYPMADTLRFTPADSGTKDSPTRFCAYKDEKPILSGGRVITAKTIMTLETSTGNMMKQRELTLTAGSGMVILNSLNSAFTDQLVVINADYESTGDGTLTIAAGKTVKSNDSDMYITAWDLDLQGSLDMGSEAATMHASQAAQSIGIGATPQDFWMTSAEMNRITGGNGVTIGSTSNGAITVHGVSQATSDPILTQI